MMTERDKKRVRRLKKILRTMNQEMLYAQAQVDFMDHGQLRDDAFKAMEKVRQRVEDFADILEDLDE